MDMLAEVDRQREATIGFLQALIRAARDGEDAIQQVVADRLAQIGCHVEQISYLPHEVKLTREFAAEQAMDMLERRSVVGRLPGAGQGRSLIFFAHPDGEAVRGTDTWTHDPFAAVVENGRLYGWGVADDLAGVAASVSALEAVLASGVRPAGDVILASTPSKRHARGVAALMQQGMSADAAIYLHPAESGVGLTQIKAFAGGQVEFRITITGRLPDTREPGHTAFYHVAVNPLDKAWVIYRALMALGEQRGRDVHHPALDAAIGRSTNLQVSSTHCGEENRFSRLPRVCVMGGALSFPPTETMAEVQAQVEAAVRAAALADDWLRDNPPVLAWHSGVTGVEVATDHPLYRVVSDAVLATTGETPVVNPLHTASDIRNPMVQKGIPTVGLGSLAGDLTQVGGHDEWVDVEDYLRMVRIAAAVIVDWCGVADASRKKS